MTNIEKLAKILREKADAIEKTPDPNESLLAGKFPAELAQWHRTVQEAWVRDLVNAYVLKGCLTEHFAKILTSFPGPLRTAAFKQLVKVGDTKTWSWLQEANCFRQDIEAFRVEFSESDEKELPGGSKVFIWLKDWLRPNVVESAGEKK